MSRRDWPDPLSSLDAERCSVYICPGVIKYPGDVSAHAQVTRCH